MLDVKEMRHDIVDWIHLAQDMIQLQSLVKTFS
jgi:hypothetical protein